MAACACSDPDDEEDTKVMGRIASGQQTLRRLRWKMGGTMFALGCFLGVAWEIGYRYQSHQQLLFACSHGLAAHLLFISTEFCLRVRLLVWSVAPLADDLAVTRTFVLLEFLVMGMLFMIYTRYSFHALWSILSAESTEDPSSYGTAVMLIVLGTIVLSYLGLCVRAVFIRDAVAMHSFLWRSIFWVSVVSLLPRIGLCICVTITCQLITPAWWGIPATLLSIYIARNHALREQVHAALNRLLEERSSRRGAAGIAALVGRCHANEVLSQARGRFRAVHLSDLTVEDIMDNRPSPALSAKTFLVKLQECDAFVSHSWHDDPEAKWVALQQWRKEFLHDFGWEPKVWIDKCCIDQKNIDADLRCLPVFLSGCKRLVVLCGPTYLSRLWCIMELFTYVHIGRHMQDIEFVHADGRCSDHVSRGASLRDGLQAFDARRCQCSVPADRERMLRIVRAAFGSLDAFNDAVRESLGVHREIRSLEAPDISEDANSDEDSDGLKTVGHAFEVRRANPM